MRTIILQTVLLCFALMLTNCKKEEDGGSNSTSSTQTSYLKSTSTTIALRGINWADPNGNEASERVVLPSGLTSGMTSTQAAAVAKNIADALITSGGTTVRMPINYWTTTSSSYWSVYQAAINAIVSEGCKVILCWWPTSGHSVSDTSKWYTMWTNVNNVYKDNSSVLYEPINEPVDYSSTNLCNLYYSFITRYSPSSLKCIFDGTGYAADVTSVGADSRLSSQYLGLHCYWWFWGGYTVWSSAYNKMATLVGDYASRTVVTGIGVETFRTFDFWWQWQTGAENDVAFLMGSLTYARDNYIGTIAWSGVNDIDTYRWYYAYDDLVEVNPGCANMFRWSWRLSSIWRGEVANGTYKFMNRASGLYLDSYGLTTTSSSVYQYTSSSSTNQNWEISHVNGYYWIYSISGGLCLDASSNTADGSAILQVTRNSPSSATNSQQWTITQVGSTGYYKIINRSTGKCLDTGGLTASGSALQQWSSGSSYNQQWTLVQQ
jgi:hypothetical protein